MFEGLNEADVQSAVDAAQPATMKPQQYAAMLREVFAVVLVKWPRVKNIDGLFLGGPPDVSLSELVAAIEHNEHSTALAQALRLITLVLETQPLRKVFDVTGAGRKEEDGEGTETTRCAWRDFVRLLVSIPDRVANRLQQQQDQQSFQLLDRNAFIQRLVSQALEAAFDATDQSVTAAVFSSELINKICAQGYTDLCARLALPLARKSSAKSAPLFLDQLTGVNQENAIAALLLENEKTASRDPGWYHQTVLLLRRLWPRDHSDVLDNWIVQRALFRRQKSGSPFQAATVAAIVRFVASKSSGLLAALLQKALTMWSDRNWLRFATIDEQWTATHALVLCLAHSSKEAIENSSFFIQFMGAVQAYLESSVVEVRFLGMVTAEVVTKKIKSVPNSTAVLDFGLEQSPIFAAFPATTRARLVAFKTLAEDDATAYALSEQAQPMTLHPPKADPVTANVSSDHPSNNDRGEESDSDDDDLVPMAIDPSQMSKRATVTVPPVQETAPPQKVVRVPAYLRDLGRGLRSGKDDYPRFEASLKVAADLVRRSGERELEDCASDIASVIVRLENEFAYEQFDACRQEALTALVARAPAIIVPYLAEQWHDRGYTIVQRVFMLECLSAGALELSAGAAAPSSLSTVAKTPLIQDASIAAQDDSLVPLIRRTGAITTAKQSSLDVVSARIAANTRRNTQSLKAIAEAKSKQTSRPNRLSPFAGLFIFPFLHARQNSITIVSSTAANSAAANLAGGFAVEQTLLLDKLLQMITVVLYHVGGAPQIGSISSAVWEALMSLRFHGGVTVRRRVIMAIAVLVSVVPSHVLLERHLAQMLEAREWCDDIFHNEPDAECRDLAAHASNLIAGVVQSSPDLQMMSKLVHGWQQ